MQWPILTIGNVNLNRHRRTFLKALAACPLCAALKVEAQESRHWTYEGDAGSEKWGELDSAYQACGTGTEQSPIDIKSYQMAAIEDLKFDWQPAAYPVANNGHTIQINVPSGSTLSLGTEQFAFRQFHFHSPSEHSLNGERSAMEVHFVHALGSKKFVVMAVLLNPGQRNETFATLMGSAPGKLGTQPISQPVDIKTLLPASRAVFRYRGSLTTPPCTENVDWIVFENMVEVAQTDINIFKLIFPMNARPAQKVNRRFVLKGLI